MSLWPPQTWNGVGNTEAGVAPFTGPSARRRPGQLSNPRAPARALPHPWWERKAASQARADCSCPAATRGCGWPRPHPRCPLQAGRHSAGSSAFHPVHRGTPGLCFFSSESG